MTDITTREAKGSALTWAELDANFTNLKATADSAVQPNAPATFTTLNANGLTTLRNTSGTNVAVLDDGVTSDRYSFLRDTGGGAYLRFNSGGGGLRNATANGITFQTNNGTTQAIVSHTASAVNYVQVTGSATGGRVTLSAQGSDTNVGMVYNTKGAQNHVFSTNSGNPQFVVSNRPSAANWVQAQGNTAGNPPSFTSEGSDTNIDLAILAKGAGVVQVGSAFSTGTPLSVKSSANANTARGITFDIGEAAYPYARTLVASGSGGALSTFVSDGSYEPTEQFRVQRSSSSAVNYVQVTGAATGTRVVLSAQGSDATVGMTYSVKGSTLHAFTNSEGTQFAINPTGATIANRLNVAGAAAGQSPVLSTSGTDTNIDLTLTPKGTGSVRFGTYTANMGLLVQGYIEIKDSGGTVRKLAVIA